ncbi:Flp pilus assembly protein CpaB [Dactylosporangium vinaceum]|uniref:Flp pilus assembly protein CpaB n=1 Tax=Dactylosporangium vinaceum TaxID=53362 RepID=A0ABV5MDS8_9ACTN|nr:Flp pilus assembly protein CpaB [Dactylosporangium vinaceum]UAC01058.1 Flp pilus assembly protein CpaB [Dactylosporangium vinaceum]
MRRRLLLALVAFGLACLSVALMAAYARRADERAVADREPVRVYVAAKRVAAGTAAKALRDNGLADLVVMPASTVPADALTSIGPAIEALVLTAPVERGQLLMRGMFDRTSVVTGGLSVPDGMLAVSVPVKLEGAVADYVRAGADVTVFLTAGDPEGTGPSPVVSATRMATRVLLSRVRVLAVGVRPVGSEAPEPLDPNNSDATVLLTLAVEQEDAQRVVLATKTGTLYAALLSPDTWVAPGGRVDTDRLFR